MATAVHLQRFLLLPLRGFASFGLLALLTLGVQSAGAADSKVYEPIRLQLGKQVVDKLSSKDIPTGQNGFARDYIVELKEGDQLAIDLSSENFDTILTLLSADGSTVAENDDGPDGSTNSLLFTRITKTGTYYIRVRAFGELAAGNFKLKVTLLEPKSR